LQAISSSDLDKALYIDPNGSKAITAFYPRQRIILADLTPKLQKGLSLANSLQPVSQ
jgi:hypothetical protein